MLNFFRKKDPKDRLYPSFTTRMFASTIDFAIFAIFLIPVSALITYFIYGGELPSAELRNILQSIFSRSSGLKALINNISNDQAYNAFIAEGKFKGVIVEQSIQFALVSIVILGFWIKTHSTPGKMLLSLKIVNEKDLSEPTILQLVIRLLSYAVSFLPLGLGFLYILMNKKRRGFHDLISETVVVSKRYLPHNLKNPPV